MDAHYLIRHLERLPLGTSYPAIGARVAAVVAGVAERTGFVPTLYLDATGVGTPVVDTLRSHGVRGTLVPVYFTYGDRRSTRDDGSVSLGKAWLVSRLQALLQSGLLHLPQTPEAQTLAHELLDYEIKVDEDANERYGAFRVGSHDDLVTALGLAIQAEPRPTVTVTRFEPPAPAPEAMDWTAQRQGGRAELGW
jgi:hypothetical protein